MDNAVDIPQKRMNETEAVDCRCLCGWHHDDMAHTAEGASLIPAPSPSREGNCDS